MPSRVRVFVDFDGTISLEDTTDVILERFADPKWRRIEADWLDGKIGSHDCMAQQIALVRASPAALDEVVRAVPIDPHFGEFVSLCHKYGIPVTVVSDGLDRAIAKMLSQAGINVPLIANHLKWIGGDRWQLQFPAAQDACRTAAGNCKCAALTREPHTLRVLVGDGRSDFCAAEAADLVVAKGALAEHCQAAGLPYMVFGNFAGATTLVADWIAALDRRDRREQAGSIHASPSA
jgi:2,3-diketo-5-methylthio-1-phosphopentane phosphatase